MLRVLGVSSPHYIKRNDKIISSSLNSSDPFSLYNAYKWAAYKAENNDENWGDSNWSTIAGRNNSIMLLQYYYNDVPRFVKKLKEINPNLLFIGSMTLGFAGAYRIAELAKKILGDSVFIVLGGKHVGETMFEENGTVKQLRSSPLLLMKENKIPKVFDIICSGDGEEILYEIGNGVNQCLKERKKLNQVYKYYGLKKAKGEWCLGWLNEQNECEFIISNKEPLDYDKLPLTSDLFAISAKFNVFKNSDLTAHTMSYLSKGCVYNCFYCSECSRINGNLKQFTTGAQRLYKNLASIQKIGLERYSTNKMSAFVEDSIMLAGSPLLLNELSMLLKENPLNIEFGGQFTIDRLLDEKVQEVVSKLSRQGLKYIFVGLETNNENIAETMSKNVCQKNISWLKKNEKAIEFIKRHNMKYGVSVLLGLGETQKDRLNLLKTIKFWQQKYGIPNVVSMNLAVRHPLRSSEEYDYIDWGTSLDSAYLSIFTQMFGEASEKYIMSGVGIPTIEDLKELKYLYDEIKDFGL